MSKYFVSTSSYHYVTSHLGSVWLSSIHVTLYSWHRLIITSTKWVGEQDAYIDKGYLSGSLEAFSLNLRQSLLPRRSRFTEVQKLGHQLWREHRFVINDPQLKDNQFYRIARDQTAFLLASWVLLGPVFLSALPVKIAQKIKIAPFCVLCALHDQYYTTP